MHGAVRAHSEQEFFAAAGAMLPLRESVWRAGWRWVARADGAQLNTMVRNIVTRDGRGEGHGHAHCI